MVEDGPVDFLTGDYLAELTMALLWRARTKDPGGGYARTFLSQMEEVLGTCVDNDIRVVVNAGGLNPLGLAAAIRGLGHDLGLAPAVAAVTGDDLMGRLDEVALRPFCDGPPVEDLRLVSANVYLGCWGIVEALDRGARIVVTGRVTDAALVMGPAAHHFGWGRDDWDRLAGALVAGHVIECGAQVTGGNYPFFEDVPGLEHVGFPLVEMSDDGSFVVTKHPNTGGLVSPGTVTAQLLYEIGGHRYLNPDVTARFDTIRLRPDGPDRVAVDGVAGEPPPPMLKVAVNRLGGFRNTVTLVLTGLDIDEKAAVAEKALWASLGGRESVAESDVQLLRWDRAEPRTNLEAMAHLRFTVKDPDQTQVGRRFSGAAVELALASYPGYFATDPPADASPYVVYAPAVVDRSAVPAMVHLDDQDPFEVPSVAPATSEETDDVEVEVAEWPDDVGTVEVPLGRLVGARSGDKGGDANVGLWVTDPEAFPWLVAALTVEQFRRLLPETSELTVDRHVFPNLGAVNFVVRGLLGEGVASSSRIDPQAKSLGEYVRSRVVAMPTRFVAPWEDGDAPVA